MMDLFTPDPEGNPEEEAEITYRLQEAVHDFEDANHNGKCTAPARKFCYEHKVSDYCRPCGSDSWSVLHYNERLDNHDHGGGDCMCFEMDDQYE